MKIRDAKRTEDLGVPILRPASAWSDLRAKVRNGLINIRSIGTKLFGFEGSPIAAGQICISNVTGNTTANEELVRDD